MVGGRREGAHHSAETVHHPVVVDDPQGDPSTYRQVPDEFRRYNFGHAPTGEPNADLRSMLVDEIRAMRRIGAV
jgi:hypothetical protein